MNEIVMLKVVLNHMNKISVCGKDNIDALLGSMQAIEQVIASLTNKHDESIQTIKQTDLEGNDVT